MTPPLPPSLPPPPSPCPASRCIHSRLSLPPSSGVACCPPVLSSLGKLFLTSHPASRMSASYILFNTLPICTVFLSVARYRLEMTDSCTHTERYSKTQLHKQNRARKRGSRERGEERDSARGKTRPPSGERDEAHDAEGGRRGGGTGIRGGRRGETGRCRLGVRAAPLGPTRPRPRLPGSVRAAASRAPRRLRSAPARVSRRREDQEGRRAMAYHTLALLTCEVCAHPQHKHFRPCVLVVEHRVVVVPLHAEEGVPRHQVETQK